MALNTNKMTAEDLVEIRKMKTDTLLELYAITFDMIQKMLLEEIFQLRGIEIPIEILEPPKQYA
jgi:hypothetical protein